MTKEKWLEIWKEEVENRLYVATDPIEWDIIRCNFVQFIEVMDEATEVYNMENGVTDGN